MLTANDILDIFMLPIGFYVNNRIYEVFEATGLLWLPFMIVAVMVVIEVRMNGLKGEQAVEMILTQLEIKFICMATILMVAVVPYEGGKPTTPNEINYAVTSCNDKFRRVVVGDSIPQMKEAFGYTHNIESYSNLAYGFTNVVSTGVVNGVVATLPCSIGYKDYQYARESTMLQSVKVQNVVAAFAQQCYVPALQDVLQASADEFNAITDSYLEHYGVVAPKLINRYADPERPLIMTTRLSDWDKPPVDNVITGQTMSVSCYKAIELVGTAVLGDENIKEKVGATLVAAKDGSMWPLIMIGKPDSKFAIKDEDAIKKDFIQNVFSEFVGPAKSNYQNRGGAPLEERSWMEIASMGVGDAIALIGAAIAWAVASGTAAVAVDIIPWMISILQGVVAAFSILILFFNCYSGRSVVIVIGTVVALECALLALELAIWIDNIVFTILHTKIASGGGPAHGSFLAGFVSLLCYISVPMFAYKWISQHIGAGTAAGDLSGSADRMGAVGFAGLMKVAAGAGSLGKAGDKLKNDKEGGDSLRKELNPKA